MKFDETIKIGDLLTSVSVLISAATLAIAWWRDRALRRRELADKIRSAAGNTLARLERWQEISLALFVDAQPLFVEVSEELAKEYDVTAARDKLWRELNRIRLTLLREVREEEIETAYVDLFTYRPEIRNGFREAIAKIKIAEEQTFEELLQGTQNDVMSFDGKEASYQTAELGNLLRSTAGEWEEKCIVAIQDAIAPVQEFLLALMKQSDRDVLGKSKVLPS